VSGDVVKKRGLRNGNLVNLLSDKGLNEMCADVWRWQSNNPDGYA
jgi:hypothetical protein